MKSDVPLNGLRAFEASARHLSFTKAGLELFVSQAAVSQQVRILEDKLGIMLFRRLPRGLEMTDEGRLLLSEVTDAFNHLEKAYRRFKEGSSREVLTISCIGTFALGWLLPNSSEFHSAHPSIELNIQTNNNVVNVAGEGVDFAIRYGSGGWAISNHDLLFNAPLTVLCRPDTATRIKNPSDVLGETLFRSYRQDEWDSWFKVAGLSPVKVNGPMFDSSRLIIDAVMITGGVALAPASMFRREIDAGLLVQPFAISTGDDDGYWLTWQKTRKLSPSMEIFREWIIKNTQDWR